MGVSAIGWGPGEKEAADEAGRRAQDLLDRVNSQIEAGNHAAAAKHAIDGVRVALSMLQILPLGDSISPVVAMGAKMIGAVLELLEGVLEG